MNKLKLDIQSKPAISNNYNWGHLYSSLTSLLLQFVDGILWQVHFLSFHEIQPKKYCLLEKLHSKISRDLHTMIKQSYSPKGNLLLSLCFNSQDLIVNSPIQLLHIFL